MPFQYNVQTGLSNSDEGYTPESSGMPGISLEGLSSDPDEALRQIEERKRQAEQERQRLEAEALRAKTGGGDNRPFFADSFGGGVSDLFKGIGNAGVSLATDLVDIGAGAIDIVKGVGSDIMKGGEAETGPVGIAKGVQAYAQGGLPGLWEQQQKGIAAATQYVDDADNPLTEWRENNLANYESQGGQLVGNILRLGAAVATLPKVGAWAGLKLAKEAEAVGAAAKVAKGAEAGLDANKVLSAVTGTDDFLAPFVALQKQFSVEKGATGAIKAAKGVAENPGMYASYRAIAKAATVDPEVGKFQLFMDATKASIKSLGPANNWAGPKSLASAFGWDAFASFNAAGEGNDYNDQTMSDWLMTQPGAEGLRAMASTFTTRVEDTSIDRKIKQTVEGTILGMGMSTLFAQIKAARWASAFRSANDAQKGLILSKFDSLSEELGADLMKPYMPKVALSSPIDRPFDDVVEVGSSPSGFIRTAKGEGPSTLDLSDLRVARARGPVNNAAASQRVWSTEELANNTEAARAAREAMRDNPPVDEAWYASEVAKLEAPPATMTPGAPEGASPAGGALSADRAPTQWTQGGTAIVPSPGGALEAFNATGEPIRGVELPYVGPRPRVETPSPDVIRRSVEEQWRRAQLDGTLSDMIEGPDGIFRNKVQASIVDSVKRILPSKAVDLLDYAMKNGPMVNPNGTQDAVLSLIHNISVERGLNEGWVEIGPDFKPRFIRSAAVAADQNNMLYEEGQALDDLMTLKTSEIDLDQSLAAGAQEGSLSRGDIAAEQGIVETPISQRQTVDLANAEMGGAPPPAEPIQDAAMAGAKGVSNDQAAYDAAEADRLAKIATAPPAPMNDEQAVREMLGYGIDELPQATVTKTGASRWAAIDDDGIELGNARTKTGAQAIADRQNKLNRDRAIAQARTMANDNVGSTAPFIPGTPVTNSEDLRASFRLTRPQAQALQGLSPDLDAQIASSGKFNRPDGPAFVNAADAPKLAQEATVSMSQRAMAELRDGLQQVIENGEVSGNQLAMLKRMADKLDDQILTLEPQARADFYLQKLIDENARLLAYGKNCIPV